MATENVDVGMIPEDRLETHKWQPTVAAGLDLRLVHVDEDARVAEGAATAIARNNAVFDPADGLLVDQLNGSIGSRLWGRHVSHPYA